MLKAVKMIIGRKVVQRKAPLVATAREVYEMTGKRLTVQIDEAAVLEGKGIVIIGKTFNDIYYKIV